MTYFGPFRLESNTRLWHGEHLVALRPRALAVLRYLAERPGQLVTKEALLTHLWPGLYVAPTVLRVCVHAIRHALQDSPAVPQFLETVGRQGYRFIGAVRAPAGALSLQSSAVRGRAGAQALGLPYTLPSTPSFVGRAPELARLHAAFARAQQGERQVVLLLGEPGIGKTTLVDRFLAQVQLRAPVRIGRGQCLDHYGPGEAYLPLLEALGQLCQGADGAQVIALLRRYAPLWLVQMGGLLEAHDLAALQRHVQDSSRERMVREFAEAVEMLAADTGLVLVCEDLQWSDASTVEALAYLAQRRRAARVQLIGTYRPADVAVREHPLRRVVQELYGHGQCEELALELFTAAEVETYLAWRFGQRPADPTVSQTIHDYTDGNPLFMVHFVDDLCQQGLLIDQGGGVAFQGERAALKGRVPETLQQLITRQIEALRPDERQLLGIASVAGQTFTAAEVARVGGGVLEDIEAVCDTLVAQERFIVGEGSAEWPDGTLTGQYRFLHALYQEVFYEQIGPARRRRVHGQLGACKEAGYGDRVAEIAGQLAAHFTQGRDAGRAARYHGQAAENAFHRSAYHEALGHCREGLALLEQVVDTPARQRQELTLRMTLATTLTATQGFGAAELGQTYTRARALCHALQDDPMLVSVLVGLGRYHDLRMDRDAVAQITDDELRLLDRVHDPILALQLHTHLGTSSLLRGVHEHTQAHHGRVLALYNPQWHQELVLRFSVDPAVVAEVISGCSLWMMGWPDQARTRLQHGLTRARELGHPYSRCLACIRAAEVYLWCGALADVERLVDEGRRLARAYGVALFRVHGGILQAYVHVRRSPSDAGLARLADGVAQYRGLGASSALPSHLCYVADAYRQMGRLDEGLATMADAVRLTETAANVCWAAEVYRLQGEILLATTLQAMAPRGAGQDTSGGASSQSSVSPPHAEAENCFHTALALARQQGAKALELRAAMSLSRLWQRQRKHAAAHELLAPICGWFTEGFDTADLQAAKTLLEDLEG